MTAILNSGTRPTTDNVDRVISESGMSENMGVEVEIAAISHRSKLIFIYSLVVAFLNSGIT